MMNPLYQPDSHTQVHFMRIFCLHFLGGSARSWVPVAKRLSASIRIAPIDLPGFGDATHTSGYDIAEMAKQVAQVVRSAGPQPWMLAGHSMGAKVACVIARNAEDGEAGLTELKGIILLAGSPPSPEPMEEQRRQALLGAYQGDRQSSRREAQDFIDSNVGRRLPVDLRECAVDDVLRMNGDAWRAWLKSGSREDWRLRVGVLQTPTLLIAGEKDSDLGPAAQRALMEPHFAHVRSVVLPNARHLLPLECPDEVARLFDEHVRLVGSYGAAEDSRSGAYRRLIASDRVSARTRSVLQCRAHSDDWNYAPKVLSVPSLEILRAVLARVIPQGTNTSIDLAARIDQQLTLGVGDGWRMAMLPSDANAHRAGLLTLNESAKFEFGQDFILLESSAQDKLLRNVMDNLGSTSPAPPSLPERLNANQMRCWFADLCVDAVRLYVAHPDVLSALGYSGIANGGDGMPKSGFTRLGRGEREAWEPESKRERPT